MKSKSFKSLLKLWKHLKKSHKILFVLVCTLSIVAASLEALVILTFIPFITNITGSSDKNSSFLDSFNSTEILDLENRTSAFIIFLTVIVISSLSRLIYIYLTTKTSAKIGSYLSKKVYSKLLNKSYLEHVSQDSSYVIQMVTSNIGRTVGIISSCSLIISSSLVTLAILYLLSNGGYFSLC